jgi:hypothetical protein
MISLPIPEISCRNTLGDHGCPEKHLSYQDLADERGKYVARLVTQLTNKTNNRFGTSDCVHLDPDIRPELRREEDRLSPLTFGQSSSSQTELKNREVQKGDLFLFFGWFRKACESISGSFYFDKDEPDLHAIWGWLQIEKYLDLNDCTQHEMARKIAAHHPHVLRSENGKANCLYVAEKNLTFLPNCVGAGTFTEFRDGLRLSDMQTDLPPRKRLRSRWRLPAFFEKVAMTHLPHLDKWEHIDISIVGKGARGRGQEFIFETKGHEAEVAKWLEGIFTGERRQFS